MAMSVFFAQQNFENVNIQTLVMIGLLIAAMVGGLISLVVFWNFGSLWLQAKTSGADVTMSSLIGMYFRQVRSQVIVNAKIMAAQAGLDIDRTNGISTQRL